MHSLLLCERSLRLTWCVRSVVDVRILDYFLHLAIILILLQYVGSTS